MLAQSPEGTARQSGRAFRAQAEALPAALDSQILGRVEVRAGDSVVIDGSTLSVLARQSESEVDVENNWKIQSRPSVTNYE